MFSFSSWSWSWSWSSLRSQLTQLYDDKNAFYLFFLFFFGCPGFPGSSAPPSSASSSSSSPSPPSSSSSPPSPPPPPVSPSLPGGGSYCSFRFIFPCDKKRQKRCIIQRNFRLNTTGCFSCWFLEPQSYILFKGAKTHQASANMKEFYVPLRTCEILIFI